MYVYWSSEKVVSKGVCCINDTFPFCCYCRKWFQDNENGVTEKNQKYEQGNNDQRNMELGHGKQIGIERRGKRKMKYIFTRTEE